MVKHKQVHRKKQKRSLDMVKHKKVHRKKAEKKSRYGWNVWFEMLVESGFVSANWDNFRF